MATHPTTSALEQAKVSALLNGRYHADREAWFDGWRRIFMFGIILSGSSALLDLVPWAKAGAALLAVAFGAADLVFSLSDRARKHAFLRKQYFTVAAQLELPRASAAKAQDDGTGGRRGASLFCSPRLGRELGNARSAGF